MSLATRCTACGTVFRVVQDQLKVSEGWVRCGRCKEVFNALEALFDLEREAPPDWQQSASAAAAQRLQGAAPAAASEAGPLPLPLFQRSAESPDEEQGSTLAFPEVPSVALAEPGAPGRAAELDSETSDSREFADARFNSELALDEAGSDAPAPTSDTASEPSPPDETPFFLRDAPVRQRVQPPAVRAAMAASLLLLLAMLGLQVAYHHRDAIAADWPQARPVLAGLCSWLSCRIEAPRRIHDIAVESSALTRATAGSDSDALRLSIALRNRSTVGLAMPTVDLSLTDTNGELVARRALSAADFNSRAAVLAPSSETTLQLLLSTEGRRVAGYTVEIFYP